jgi:hypothetical protein
MDQYTALMSTGTGGTLLLIAVYIYKTFNHKRVRSNCCGKKLEMSLDVDETTPPRQNFQVNNPLARPPPDAS